MNCFSEVDVLYFCLTVSLLTLQSIAKSNDCPLNSTNKTEIKEPIILTNITGKLEFYLPSVENNKLVFEDNQKFIVSCPNPRNLLTISNSNVTTGQCINSKLNIAGKSQSFNQLSCNKSIRGDVQKLIGKLCKSNSRIGSSIDIGYYVSTSPQKIDFVPLINVCHDLEKGNTYYSEHILIGKLIKKASRSNFRPGFSTQGLNISASIAYKQQYQKATFTKLLGSANLAENYINNKSFLSRGHLSPDADFLFAPWQFSTYFYLNAVPQWQAVNGGNWHKLESMVRKLAGQLKANLRIITGTHGVLTLSGVNQTDVEIFMLPKRVLPVPKFIWKLVYRPDTREAIVLIVLNNPFVKNIQHVERICHDNLDICKLYGWAQDNWNKAEKGFVYCCDYTNFVVKIPEISVVGVLKGPIK